MTPDAYKARFREDDTPGWSALDASLDRLYPGQPEPLHWGTVIKHGLGGPDPLDGVSAYEHPGDAAGTPPHLHFATYGYSRLYYAPEDAGKEYSGFGFEMTFRLPYPLPAPRGAGGGLRADAPVPVNWVLGLLQALARYVFKSERWFEPYEWADLKGPLRPDPDPARTSALTGLAFVPDPELPALDTPHGQVEFLQAFGLTTAEVARIKSGQQTCREIVEAHRRANPLLVTDPDRRDRPDA